MSLATLLVGSALLTAAAFAVLAFTRWGRKRPLHRYGALSVSAHLLLLAGLACVRSGGPPQSGAEDAPPIRVQIVMRTTTATVPETETEKAEPELNQEQPEAEPTEPVPLPPAPEVEQPPTEPEPETPSDSNPDQAWSGLPKAATQSDTETSQEPIESEMAAADPAPPAPVETPPSPAPPPAPVERVVETTPAEPVSTAPQAPAPSPLTPSTYSQRGQIAQRRLSRDAGGTEETLDAVAAAIDWLARAQSRDGRWDAVSWQGARETKTLGHNRRGAGARAETGITGLALLAMGGAGHTHLDGPYRDTVTRGLQFLLDKQNENGNLAGDATIYARTYCHSMATFALAEAMAVTGDERLRPAVTAAVGYLARSQNNAGGGWRYAPGDRGDMSQMGWAVMALRSAEIAGVTIDPRTWDGCERFVASVRRGRHGGLAVYDPQRGGRPSTTMTAEAMYCRQILGTSNPRSIAEGEAVAALLAETPGTKRTARGRQTANFYYWYYATLALHHHRGTGPEAETAWHRWNDAMQRTLLARQVGTGSLAGSWNPDTLWGGYGGRVYSTALATMCLEVYYRYDADLIGRDPWIAARDTPIRR